MTRAIREESAFRGATRHVPGAYRFQGFAYRNRTSRAAMRRVAAYAERLGRTMLWVSAVAS